MIKLSTGDDSTLGNYRMLAAKHFGEDTMAVKYLDKKIASSPNGANEEVLADEGAMVHMLLSITLSGISANDDSIGE